MGSKVISVEPFYDNIICIHKAANLGDFQESIILVNNALADKPNVIKTLKKYEANIGGQSLVFDRDQVFLKKDPANKYLVETVLVDDLLSLLPDDVINGAERKKCIMKIDIEGFESLALHNATKFFSVLDVQVIFMEWVWLQMHQFSAQQTEQMIQLFTRNGLHPVSNENKELDINAWKTANKWPGEIIWKKKHLSFNI